MSTAEQKATAYALRELGDAIGAMGRKVRAAGDDLIRIGRQMRDISPSMIRKDDLSALRRPFDDFYASFTVFDATALELRSIVDAVAAAMASIIGVDN